MAYGCQVDNHVTNFRGKYFFLSNFYPCRVDDFPTAEHAYQANKTDNPSIRQEIRRASSPGAAKRLAHKRLARATSAFYAHKTDIMLSVVRKKFGQNSELAGRLLETGDAELIEANGWKDRFWGTDLNLVGENNLGKILMKVRDEIRSGLRTQI